MDLLKGLKIGAVSVGPYVCVKVPPTIVTSYKITDADKVEWPRYVAQNEDASADLCRSAGRTWSWLQAAAAQSRINVTRMRTIQISSGILSRVLSIYCMKIYLQESWGIVDLFESGRSRDVWLIETPPSCSASHHICFLQRELVIFWRTTW